MDPLFVLKGVLPAMAAALLLVGVFGPRWLGVAVAVGLFAALSLLRELPLWPGELYGSTNDYLQWLCWCGLAGGLVSPFGAGPLPRWAAGSLSVLLLAGEVWLLLTNQRGRGGADTAVLHFVAIAGIGGVWLGA